MSIRYQIPLNLLKYGVTLNASNAVLRSLPTTPLASKIPCTVQPLSAEEVDQYARRQIMASHQVFSKWDFEKNLVGGLKLNYVFVDPANSHIYQIRGWGENFNPAMRLNKLYRVVVYRYII